MSLGQWFNVPEVFGVYRAWVNVRLDLDRWDRTDTSVIQRWHEIYGYLERYHE